ncbi:MAG: hypothetical protein FWG10_13765 [Eubacteriaceae bacterium]|nr:hypothetical protein [Eubacteriaceae bacterium]
MQTEALGDSSHSSGYGTVAQNAFSTAIGRFNAKAAPGDSFLPYDSALIIGNGYDGASWRSNAFRVQFDGRTHSGESFTSACAGFGEMYEWKDGNLGNEDRIGYFVSLEDGLLAKAEPGSYVIGAVSPGLSVAGNTHGCVWHEMYIKDEWGRVVYEWIEIEREPEMSADSKTADTVHAKRPVLNPGFDPAASYLPRIDRFEWAQVAMFGQTLVRDDGSCEANGFCVLGQGGIATASESGGYYVIKRTGEGQVLVLLDGPKHM